MCRTRGKREHPACRTALCKMVVLKNALTSIPTPRVFPDCRAGFTSWSAVASSLPPSRRSGAMARREGGWLETGAQRRHDNSQTRIPYWQPGRLPLPSGHLLKTELQAHGKGPAARQLVVKVERIEAVVLVGEVEQGERDLGFPAIRKSEGRTFSEQSRSWR